MNKWKSKLFILVGLLATSTFNYAKDYKPLWTSLPIHSDETFYLISGKAENTDFAFYITKEEQRKFIAFTAPISNPSPNKEIELVVDKEIFSLSLLKNKSNTAIYELTPKLFEKILESELFKIRQESSVYQIYTGNFKERYEFLVSEILGEMKSKLKKVLNDIICQSQKVIMEEAAKNRQSGLTEEQSFSKVKNNLNALDKSFRESLGDKNWLSVFYQANNQIYIMGKSIFAEEQALTAFIGVKTDECISSTNRINSTTNQREDLINRISTFFIKMLGHREELKGKDVAKIGNIFAECLLDSYYDLSPKLYEYYVNQIQSTGDIFEAVSKTREFITNSNLKIDSQQYRETMQVCFSSSL